MHKLLSQLEYSFIEKEGDEVKKVWTARFLADPDIPIPYAKEALFQFTKFLGQIEDNIKAQADAKNKEEQLSESIIQPITGE